MMLFNTEKKELGAVNMKYFAELDSNNVVVNIIQTNDNETPSSLIEKQLHTTGVKFVECCNQEPVTFRVRMAQIGGIYNPNFDRFENKQKYESWTQDETGEWVAPVAKPTAEQSADRHFVMWSEEIQKWVSPTEADYVQAQANNTPCTNYYWDNDTSTWVEITQ